MSKKKKNSLMPKPSKGAVNEINVTPLIDVVLVLLIIYMVVTPVMVHQMDVNLPEKTETVTEDNIPQEQILAAACEDGTYALNRKELTLREMTDRVRKKVIKKRLKGEKGVVFVDSHPDAGYPQVVKLMDAIREAGIQANIKVKIGLGTLKTPEEFMACTPPKEEATPVQITPTQEG
jgi:biopolymer transport protein TolR